MPIVRIDPPPRKGLNPFDAAKRFGAFLASPITTLIGSVQEIHAPRAPASFWPTELDTETGQVTVEIPRQGKGLISRKGPEFKRLGKYLEAQLESSLRAGSVVPALTGAYRELGELLISQAGLFPASTTQGSNDMASGIIPPGGFAGFAQMTPASKLALGGGKSAKRRSRKKAQRTRNKAKKARKVARNTKRRAKRAGKKKLVKGSAAAKAYMARIRKLRK